MIYVWALVSSSLVVTCEAVFKHTDNYFARVWLFIPLALMINYAIFRLVSLSPNLPAAFVVFSTINIVTRTVVSLWLGHLIGPGTWIAIGLLLVASAARHVWP